MFPRAGIGLVRKCGEDVLRINRFPSAHIRIHYAVFQETALKCCLVPMYNFGEVCGARGWSHSRLHSAGFAQAELALWESKL